MRHLPRSRAISFVANTIDGISSSSQTAERPPGAQCRQTAPRGSTGTVHFKLPLACGWDCVLPAKGWSEWRGVGPSALPQPARLGASVTPGVESVGELADVDGRYID